MSKTMTDMKKIHKLHEILYNARLEYWISEPEYKELNEFVTSIGFGALNIEGLEQ